ncbi:hypothetical protein R1sor_013655 [Riccia sorocarpa]|uniref:DNA2/NAM7 helicase helicase domain-containing protein n=1 Tax=Riccia sorocarpa TaxID=122646 RepID=A0ABD3H952_9MARC
MCHFWSPDHSRLDRNSLEALPVSSRSCSTTAIALRYREEPKIRLIKGPPGTGKTAVVDSLLSVITCLDYRTLVCARANRAICEVAQSWTCLCSEFGPFRSLVIDEAPQLAEAETAIVTQLPGLQQAVLVGDEKQLQSTVLSMMARDIGDGRSLFERLQMVKHPHQLLRTQYRMHPEISSFPNRELYGDCIEDDKSVNDDMNKKPYQNQ